MNGVGRLIKNELIKIFGQLSWKIITVFILIMALVSPLLNTFVNNLTYSSDGYWRKESEAFEEGSVEREYYDAMADVEEFFYEKEITFDDWRYDEFYDEYDLLTSEERAYKLVSEGKTPEEVFEWFYARSVESEWDNDDNITVTYKDNDGNVVPLTAEIAKSEYQNAKKELEKLTDTILNSTIKDYAKTYVANIKDSIAKYEMNLAEKKAAYEENVSSFTDYQAAAYDLYAYKAALVVWEKLENASREDEEWLINTANRIFYYTDKGEQLAIVNKEDFEKNTGLLATYGDYDKYCEVQEKMLYDNKAAIDVLKYSAENGCPLPEMYPESTREIIDSVLTDNASTALLLCMILAAMIVASEHMSGTVRLLLIRPRARWKVLLSKLAAVVIYGLAAFLVTTVLSVVMTLIVSGVGDIAVPMLVPRNGTVKEVSMVLYVIVKTFIISLPSILVVVLAFFLSVVTKKIVFSVTIPMFLSMFGTVASSLSMWFGGKFPFIKWTILPYYYIEPYVEDVVSRTSYASGYDLVTMGFELEIGIILMLFSIALVTALSFVVFKRQQIKN